MKTLLVVSNLGTWDSDTLGVIDIMQVAERANLTTLLKKYALNNFKDDIKKIISIREVVIDSPELINEEFFINTYYTGKNQIMLLINEEIFIGLADVSNQV